MTVDLRPRQLLEKYTSLVGTLLLEHGDALLEFDVAQQACDQLQHGCEA